MNHRIVPKAEAPQGEQLYADQRLELRLCQYKTRHEEAVPRALVIHPGAVVIVPVTDDGDFVLIKNQRQSVGLSLWEFPAGTLEPGEDPLTAARRELVEESGYEADALQALGGFFAAPGYSTEVLQLFVARRLRWVGQSLDPTEHITPARRSHAQLMEMIRSGQIVDAKTLASLTLYWSQSTLESRD